MCWRDVLSVFIRLRLCSASATPLPSRKMVCASVWSFPIFTLILLPIPAYSDLAKQPVSEWGRTRCCVARTREEASWEAIELCASRKLLKAAAAQTCPVPDFILYPGDSLAHDWRARYEKLRCVRVATTAKRIGFTRKVFNSLR